MAKLTAHYATDHGTYEMVELDLIDYSAALKTEPTKWSLDPPSPGATIHDRRAPSGAIPAPRGSDLTRIANMKPKG